MTATASQPETREIVVEDVLPHAPELVWKTLATGELTPASEEVQIIGVRNGYCAQQCQGDGQRANEGPDEHAECEAFHDDDPLRMALSSLSPAVSDVRYTLGSSPEPG